MNQKNKIKAIISFAVALAFIMPVTVFANDAGPSTFGDTIVSIDPLTQTVNNGVSFTVDVYIEPGEPISGAQLDLYFDQTIVQADLVTEGDLFSGHDVLFRPGTIDNGAGTIMGVYGVVIDELPLPTEPGVFVTISFTSLDKFGTSTLDLDAVKVVDYWGQAVPIVVKDGSVTVEASPEYFDLTISVNGHGTTVPTPGVHTYIAYTVVDLEAIHDLGWTFDSWTGPDAGEIVDDNITMTKDMFITAYFTEDHYTLTVSNVGGGHVDVDPDKEFYLYGEEPGLTAVADSDWTFDSWSGDLSGNTNPTTIFMDDNKDVTATFTEEGDTIPPVTICILDPEFPDGDNGWYTVPVNATLIATDEGAGVESTWYRLDGGYWRIYTKPFVVCGEGLHKIEYYSFDRAEPRNKEDVKITEVKIDAKPPVTTHKFDGMMVEGCFISNVTVTLSAGDKMSGVNYTMYNLSNNTWVVYNDLFVVTEDGEYMLYYYSVDLAGNIESTNEAWFKIEHDTVPPVTSHTFSGAMGDNNWYVSNVAVTLTAVDNLAGVDYTKYKLDDDVEWQDYTGLFPVTEDGMHNIIYYSVDKVGNKENVSDSFDFKIDQTSPTIDLTAEGSGKTWLLIADVYDETSGIAKVEFYVAGRYLGEVTSVPYEWEYTEASSDETAQAIAYDNAGNLKISTPPTDAVPQSQDLIGYSLFLIGLITNVEESENIITAQATWLRYIEIAPTGITAGFVKMKSVEFSNYNLFGRIRSFGRMSLVFGIFKSGITIENE